MRKSLRNRRSIASAIFDTLEERRLLCFYVPEPTSPWEDVVINTSAQSDTYYTKVDSELSADAENGVTANDFINLWFFPDRDNTPTLLQTTQHGQLQFNSDGSFTYTPDAGFEGEDRFVYSLGEGSYALIDPEDPESAIFSENVGFVTLNVISKPVAIDDSYIYDLALPVTVDAVEGVLANDINLYGENLTVSLVEGPESGQFTLNPDGSFTFTADPDSITYDENGVGVCYTDGFVFSYQIDGVEDSTAYVYIGERCIYRYLNGEEDPDVAEPVETYTSDWGFDITAYVPVNGSNTFPCPAIIMDYPGEIYPAMEVLTAPENGTVVINDDDSYTYTANAGFTGTDSFTLKLIYPGGSSQNYDRSVTVIDAPVGRDDFYFLLLDAPLCVNAEEGVLANDVNFAGDELTVSVVDQPENGQVFLNPDGSFVYIPNEGSTDEDYFSYVIDGTNSVACVKLSNHFIYTTNTGGGEEVPADLNTDEDTPISFDDEDFGDGTEDPGFDMEPLHGQIIENEDGTITYIPDEDFHGKDYLFYTLGDRVLYKTLSIKPVNDAPAARHRMISFGYKEIVTIDPKESFEESDNPNLTYQITKRPKHGAAILNDNGTPDDASDDVVMYIPHSGYYGKDVFTLACSDGADESESLVTVQTQRAGLKANSKNPAKQDLLVMGTDGDDTIKLLVNKKGKIKVLLNGESQGLFKPTGQIIVKGLDGNDVIDASKVKRSIRIYGGDGNDKLLGSAVKCSRIFGGAGNDVMSGTSHMSTFFDGGKGRNVINFYPSFDISQE